MGSCRINVEADFAATKGLKQPKTKYINLHLDNAILMMDRRKICKKIRATQAFVWYQSTYNWNNTTNKTWWAPLGSVLQQMSIEQLPTLLKFIH
jgi:hypothetical protein